jgi:polar amino acid transport system substrate-binding protein
MYLNAASHTGRRLVPICLVALTSILVVACSSGAAQTPTTAATVTAAATAATVTAVPSATVVMVAAPSDIAAAGVIRFCSDIVSPPMEFYDANHNPAGVDIELGNEIAHRLGVQAKWVQTDFTSIIPSLQANNCDAIMSQLFDKPARALVVNFIDYILSSQSLLVPYGNPKNVQTLDDLSGLKVAVSNGSTIASLMTDENAKLKAAGKAPMNLVVLPQETDAFQQLKVGLVDAFGTTLETAGYYMKLQPNTFAFAAKPFGSVKAGIAFRQSDTALKTAVQQAFNGMVSDGTYAKILAEWNLQGDAIPQ